MSAATVAVVAAQIATDCAGDDDTLPGDGLHAPGLSERGHSLCWQTMESVVLFFDGEARVGRVSGYEEVRSSMLM